MVQCYIHFQYNYLLSVSGRPLIRHAIAIGAYRGYLRKKSRAGGFPSVAIRYSPKASLLHVVR